MDKQGTIWDSGLDMEKRLDWLIGELTLEEKFHMLSSGSGGVERLGIQGCRLGGEAAHGVEARHDQFGISEPDITTSFPEPIGMSASWDREAIRAAGEVVGKEARILYERKPGGGISRWAPTVDLLRDPRWGRNEEAYGEDPVQVGAMASAYIQGMQRNVDGHLTCAATLKHFYANNTEIGRGWKNSSISPRNKYEYYLEPFRRCIEDGQVSGVMTAYNRINGVLGLFNEDVKNILKDEFGLTHAVSDGGAMELAASYSHAAAMDAETVARSIRAGVDALSGWPDGVYAAVSEAYELGLLTEEDINAAIRNVYKTKIELGLFDDKEHAESMYAKETAMKDSCSEKIRSGKKQAEELGEPCSESARKACKTLTDKSVVLLKNDGILPMRESDLAGSVLIGPVGDKWYQDWYGGAAPEHITLLDGLKSHAINNGKEKIDYLDGCDRIRLKCGEQYLVADSEGRYRLSDTPETFILEDWGEGSYTLKNEQTGKYMIMNLAEKAIEGIATANGTKTTPAKITGRVCVGKERIFSWFDLEVFRMSAERRENDPNERESLDERGSHNEGESYNEREQDFGQQNSGQQNTRIIMRDRFGNRLYVDKDGFVVSAGSANQDLRPLTFVIEEVRNGLDEAVAAAAKADTVIMALGHHPMVNAKEEIDRATISFIPYQQRLFDEIYKVNPNIVVVLMSDYPFAICEINKKARAILWSATGSQCMGQSLADAVMGKFSPAGRLTQTWFRSDADLPDIDDYDVIGKGRTYRYFQGEVLYPFGYGLTYTNFAYRDLKVSIVSDTSEKKPGREGARQKVFGRPNGVYENLRKEDRVLKVELNVENTGNCSSDEVVQVYAKAPQGHAKRPQRQLIGFERIKEVAPGEIRRVELSISVRELAFYDVISEALLVEGGDYEIIVAPHGKSAGVSEVIRVDGANGGLRDLCKRIKADHYDEECGSQIVEGMYGFHALMAQGPNVYEPEVEGHFSASYANCRIPEDGGILRIHGEAHQNATIKVFVNDILVGELTLNTRDYDKHAAPARNHMPRAKRDEAMRKRSFPLLWADVQIPLELGRIDGLSSEHGYVLKIEVDGPFQYDWFMLRK